MLSTSFHFNRGETFVASYFYQLIILFENNKAVFYLVFEYNPTLWHCQFSLSKNGVNLCTKSITIPQIAFIKIYSPESAEPLVFLLSAETPKSKTTQPFG